MSLHSIEPRRRFSRPTAAQQAQENRAKKLWDEQEIAIIRANFPDMEAIQRALPSRQKWGIMHKCHDLGLNHFKIVEWSNREIKTLKETYHSHDKINCYNFKTVLPNRQSWPSIRSMAERLGLKRDYRRLVKKAKHPDKDMEAVRMRARDLGMQIKDLAVLVGCKDRSVFAPKHANKPKDWALIAKAVKELGGRLAIVWVEDEPEAPADAMREVGRG